MVIETFLVILTNFSGDGKSNSFTIPKSSPVTMLRPEWDTHAQVTSALSVLRDQIPMTSSPRTLDTERAKLLIRHYFVFLSICTDGTVQYRCLNTETLTLSTWPR